ncbi:MAG: hypothetical protein RR490_08890, partial [Niameybacter sp.]
CLGSCGDCGGYPSLHHLGFFHGSIIGYRWKGFKVGTVLIIIAAVVLLAWLASIAMFIAVIKTKGNPLDSTILYWFIGLFASPIVLGLYAVALPNKGVISSHVEHKCHVSVQLKDKDGVEREYWTCPECGKSWYVKSNSITSAVCGNDQCGIKVMLDR